MLEITMNHVEKYTEIESSIPVKIDYDKDMQFNVNIRPSMLDRTAFINAVIKNTYLYGTPHYFISDIMFDSLFCLSFADLSLPCGADEDGNTININIDNIDKFDIDKAYEFFSVMNVREIAEGSNPKIKKFIDELRTEINKQIEFTNQAIIAKANSTTDEVLNNVNTAINKGIELLEAGTTQLNKGGDKLLKSLTPKKLNDLIDKFMKSSDKTEKSE